MDDDEKALAEETASINRTASIEITKTDFRFAYEYLVENLIALAPLVTRAKYMGTAQAIQRMASYMHRCATACRVQAGYSGSRSRSPGCVTPGSPKMHIKSVCI